MEVIAFKTLKIYLSKNEFKYFQSWILKIKLGTLK